MSHEQEKEFEARLSRLSPVEPAEELRPKTLARAEEEALDPFAASLRHLVPESAPSDLCGCVLTRARQEMAAARRARWVSRAAAAVVAIAIPVNLWLESVSRQGIDIPVPSEELMADATLAGPEWEAHRRFYAFATGRPRSDWKWMAHYRRWEEALCSERFFKG